MRAHVYAYLLPPEIHLPPPEINHFTHLTPPYSLLMHLTLPYSPFAPYLLPLTPPLLLPYSPQKRGSNGLYITTTVKRIRTVKMVKYSLTICTVRTVRGKDLRMVPTVRTENGFTDRTNRTVREKDLRIVNTAFQSVKESGCD